MSDLQNISSCALELSGFIPNEHVDALPIHQRQAQLSHCMYEFKNLSQHMHDNAFDIVWFSENNELVLLI